MPAISRQTRHFTVLLLTSLGIIAFTLIYVFGYVPENEKRINARSYRVLQRIGENMSTSVRNYNLYVGSSFVSNAILKTVSDMNLFEEADSLSNETLLTALRTADRRDSLTGKFGLRFHFKDSGQKAEEPNTTKKIDYQEENGQLYLHFKTKISGRAFRLLEDEISRKGKLSGKIRNNEYYIKVPVDSLLNSLMRGDAFDYLIVLRQSGTKEDEKKRMVPPYTLVYNSGHSADLIPLDTLGVLANKSTENGPAQASIAGVPYKLFTLTQRVGFDEKWILYGAMPAEKYEAESRAIPIHIVSLAALMVVLVFMGFPFLKLALMNKQERLYRQDVLLSFLSLVLGVALVVLLIFDCYSYYGVDRFTEKERLEQFSKELQHNLKKEIKFLLAQIKVFEEAASAKDSRFKPNPFWLSVDQNNRIKKTSENYFPAFYRVFWSDRNGMMTNSWAPLNQNNTRAYVGYRPYFRVIQANGGWALGTETPKFVLESITSTTDGEKYAVLSTKSNLTTDTENQIRVVALATKLSSLYKTLLPPGYGFCLIDKSGKVLFHQNQNLNLNENLLEETGNNPYLKAALYGQIPVHFASNYQGNQQQLFVSPIKDLPFFLVTFVNDAYHRAFNLNLVVLTAMFLSLYLVSIAILTAFIIYLNEGLFDISFKWLWPKRDISFYYFKITVALVFIISLILLIANIRYQISVYFIHVYAALYTFVFIYSTLNCTSFRVTLRKSWLILVGFNVIGLLVSFSVFLLAGLFQILVILLFLTIDQNPKINKLLHSCCQLKVIKYILPEAQKYCRIYVAMLVFWSILISGLPAFMLFRVAYNYEAELAVRYNQAYLAQDLENVKNYNYGYTAITEILGYIPPAVVFRKQTKPYCPEYMKVFYSLRGNKATVLDSLRKSVVPDSVKILTKMGYPYTRFFNQTTYSTNSVVSKRIYYPIAYIFTKSNKFTPIIALTPEPPQPPNQKVQVSNIVGLAWPQLNGETDLLNNFIPVLQPIFQNVLANGYFLKTSYTDRWEPINRHYLQFSYQNQENHIWLSSYMPKYKVPSLFSKSGWIFWIDISVLLVLFYTLISFVIKRLFNIDLVANAQTKHWDLSLLQVTDKNKIFLISLPHSPDIKEIISEENKGYNCLFKEFNLDTSGNADDLITAKNKFNTTLKVLTSLLKKERIYYSLKFKKRPPVVFLLIQNFDYELFSKTSLELKIYILRALLTFPDAKIILQSTLHPSVWEDSLKEKQLESGRVLVDTEYTHLLQQLLVLLNTYTKMYQPLQHPVSFLPAEHKLLWNYKIAPEYLVNSKADLLGLIEKECAAAEYLEKHYIKVMQNFVHENYSTITLQRADVVSRLQNLAQFYYWSLWHSCTAEEQYFLFDMAQDGLVNSKNVQVLSSLLGKGLLIVDKDGLLKIMNESFKNFILVAVNPEDALRLEKNSTQGSSWAVYKTPLLLVLIGAILFFFFTQKTSWANIIAVLTAVSTFLSILPRFSLLIPSFLANKESKSE
ncbi:cache domain-containing protein [Adhaeribacter radiodurans]|uniref:Cache domain-containing protein n=1 Tax=Adhaeribacter radiodurans TaxID=2745197 RepID=A0A7L7LAQ6_9BACT|nr:cache domain-containing protein [Adhaeribacter radiodurans]QMU29635.1 hypothetical protein HUW48_17065 [Adhaeribacter radiodurans]